MTNLLKIVVFVPLSHADEVRKVIGDSGAGKIGNYSHNSFSIQGIGRFKPMKGASPAIGRVGDLTEVQEERIEFLCPRFLAKSTIDSIREIHPYEEVAVDVYQLIDEEDI